MRRFQDWLARVLGRELHRPWSFWLDDLPAVFGIVAVILFYRLGYQVLHQLFSSWRW